MEPIPLQQFSHWPTWPVPLRIEPGDLTITPPRTCGYLPDRLSSFRAFHAGVPSAGHRRSAVTPAQYEQLMDAGFRRDGAVLYQPLCPGCRRCVPLRVPVGRFAPTKGQRRIWRRNQDLLVSVSTPSLSPRKWELYERYQREWHDGSQAGDPLGFVMSLYRSPFNTLEFEYHLPGGSERALVGVGLCDVGERTISSVYFYFDPAHHRRSLGTFSALYEIAWAAERNIPHWYAGYWVQGCRTMEYKSRFHPAEALGTDGRWRPLPGEPAEPLV